MLGIALSRPLLSGLLRADGAILPDALTYLRIYCIGLVFQFAYNTFAAILRSIGDSRSTMYFLLISTVLNIVLDLIFVQFWAVAGVAWATVIAQAVSAVLAGLYLFIKVDIARFHKGQFRFHREMFTTSLRLGIPTSIQRARGPWHGAHAAAHQLLWRGYHLRHHRRHEAGELCHGAHYDVLHGPF